MKEGLQEIKALEKQLSGTNNFFEKLEISDRILEIKKDLGLMIPPGEGEECTSCSA